MKGLKLRTVVGLFLLVLCGAGVLVAHVWKQNAYVRLSIAAVKLGKQRAQLRNDIALLEISVGSLKKLSRLEGLAKGRFGLEYGNTPTLVYLGGRGGNAGVTAFRGAETMMGREDYARGARDAREGKDAREGTGAVAAATGAEVDGIEARGGTAGAAEPAQSAGAKLQGIAEQGKELLSGKVSWLIKGL